MDLYHRKGKQSHVCLDGHMSEIVDISGKIADLGGTEPCLLLQDCHYLA